MTGSGEATITSLYRTPFGGATSYPVELVDVRTDAGKEVRLFLKDMTSTRIAKKGIQGRRSRELSIYRDLLCRLEAGTPRFHGFIQDEAEARLSLVLEYVEGTTLESLDFQHWVLAAEWLGRFQGKCASQELRPEQKRALVAHDGGYFRATADRAQAAVAQVSTFLGTQLARALRDYDLRIAVMATQPRTVVHGSFRPSNILVDVGAVPPRVCPVDWELAAWGARLYDLAFLANGCGSPDLDTYWDAYGEGAAAYGMTVPALEEVRVVLDSFYLHKLLKSLSECVDRSFPDSTVATLVELVAQRSWGA
ncbi:MAG: aminoglycoside phosphotransferase family protein [Gemmatimonadota bacterium]